MTVTPPNPYDTAHTAAVAAYGTMATPRDAQRLDAALTAYRHALTAAGLLSDPTAPITADDIAVAARFLARESGHPRYTGDGWGILLTAPGDIDLAYDRARTLHAGDPHVLHDLLYARRLLHLALDNSGVNPVEGR